MTRRTIKYTSFLLCASALLPVVTLHAAPNTKNTAKKPTQHSAPHDMNSTQADNYSVRGHRHVLGGGMMVRQTEPKSISAVTQEYISKQSPTVSPGTLVSSLPGVQTTNEGPLSTSSEGIHIRGLDQTQIGLVYEGVPLADPV